MKVLTLVLEEGDGKKAVSYYGNMPINEAFAIIHEIIVRNAQNEAVESYKKEAKNGDNL